MARAMAMRFFWPPEPAAGCMLLFWRELLRLGKDTRASGRRKLLLALVQRFCELTCWRVLLDGKDVRNNNLQALRRVVAVVSQELFLFTASIDENIAISVSSVTSVTSF
jgi:ABC-type transport system involved in Fe-S cluster assembly fused permease/ATPase subunit